MEEFSADIKGAGAGAGAGAAARVHGGVRARWVSAYADVDCSCSVQASAFFLGKEALEDGRADGDGASHVECLFVVASEMKCHFGACWWQNPTVTHFSLLGRI